MVLVTTTASAAAAGEHGRADRQIFASRLQGRPLLDGDDLALGKVRDVVILPAVDGDPPRALGLVVQMRRRHIFVSLSRIDEISMDGAHLVGGTVDLAGYALRAGEFLASDLYGRQTSAGAVADVAITPSEKRRTGWEVPSVAISHGMLRRGSPEIVPWTECRELFEADTENSQLTSLREMAPADLATAVVTMAPTRRTELVSALDDAELADVLEEMPEADQVRLLDSLALERSADVVEEMQPDDAADLLAFMPDEQRERLLKAMQSAQAADLRRLLRYDAATRAG